MRLADGLRAPARTEVVPRSFVVNRT
jgi:hypothetical protein